MKNAWKKGLSCTILFSFILTMILSDLGGTIQAARRVPKISKKSIQLTVGQTKELTIKNASKATIQWKSKNKKYAKVKKLNKTKAKVTGIKKGKTAIKATVKAGGKKYNLTCKVEVKAKQKKKITPTQTPTQAPTQTPVVTGVPSAPPTEGPVPGPEVVFSSNFNSGQLNGFAGRYGATADIVDGGHIGKALLVSNRGNFWQGATVNLTDNILPGSTYTFTAWVKQTSGRQRTISCKYQSVGSYFGIQDVTVENDVWTKIDATVEIPAGFRDVQLYFEMPTLGTDDTIFPDFLIDEVTVTLISKGQNTDLTGLKDAFADFFTIGTAVSSFRFQDPAILKIIKHHFNSITMENELKPVSLMSTRSGTPQLISVKDAETAVPESYKETQMPQLNFTNADAMLQIAKANGISVRGHCLVWHSQTPRWFFTENYSNEEGAALVSKEVMEARMENFIKQVLYHVQTKFPGIIYAWDVLNEIYVDGSGSLRTDDSNWYLIYKDSSYGVNAFKYARKYAASGVKLFYNDFNEYYPSKRDAIYQFVKDVYNEGNIDGVGMQAHINDAGATVASVKAAIEKFDSIDPGKIEIQLTELDITLQGNTEEWQAKFYEDLFQVLITKKKEGINLTNVTLWGLHDGISWRRDGKPLLFTEGMIPKEAYYRVIKVAEEAKK